MSTRLLTQLVDLKHQVLAAVGKDLFSGEPRQQGGGGGSSWLGTVASCFSHLIPPSPALAAGFSIMIHLIARQVPDQVAKSGAPQLLSQLQVGHMREVERRRWLLVALPLHPPHHPACRPQCTSSPSC
jgi:hypothetical protein